MFKYLIIVIIMCIISVIISSSIIISSSSSATRQRGGEQRDEGREDGPHWGQPIAPPHGARARRRGLSCNII